MKKIDAGYKQLYIRPMKLKSSFAITGFILCAMALYMPVFYMGASLSGYHILLFGIGSFFEAPRSLGDVAILFSVATTIQTLFFVGMYVQQPVSLPLLILGMVGTASSFYVSFIGGSPQSVAVFFWLTGLTIAWVGQLIGLIFHSNWIIRQPR